jgi:hypothetical protein
LSTWEIATIALVLLGFSAVSGRIARSLVTPAIFFTSAGVLAGPVLGPDRSGYRRRAGQAAGGGDIDGCPLW